MLREKNFLPPNFVIYPLEEDAGPSNPTNHNNNGEEENPTTLDRISKILNEGMSGPFGQLDANTSTVSEVELDFEYQTSKQIPGERTYHELNDETLEVEIDDLMPEKYRGERGQNKKVKIKGVVQFVVVRREHGQDDSGWNFFPKEDFEKIMNKLEVRNSIAKNSHSMALDYSNMWGKIPILGMRANMPKLSKLFRQDIDHLEDPVYQYTTFPRLGLNRTLAITIMLWKNLSEMTLAALPRNLLDRNPDLQGGLRISRCKKFKASDMDVRGHSMEGVRLVQIDTNEEFRRSLYWFPRSYRFGLGSGRVIIRGGDRIEEKQQDQNGQTRPNKNGQQQNPNQSLSESAVSELLDQSSRSNMDEAEDDAKTKGAGGADGNQREGSERGRNRSSRRRRK